MKRALLFLLYALWAGSAFAFPPGQCAVLLKYGIYDEHNIVDSSEIYERTKSAYCNSSSQDWGLTIPVGDLPVTGNASFRDNACGNSSSVRYESYFLQKSARIINADIIRGFNECLRTDNAGITYVVKTTEAPERFTIDFSFVRFGDVVSDKMNVLIEGATCASAAPNKQFSGRTVDGEARQFKISTKLPMSCKRKKEDAVQITAFSLKGVVNTESITLPGWKPEKPKPTSFKFYDPLVDKLALDMCPAWASNCSPGGVNGQAAATLWCHARELGDALEVKVLLDTPSTRIITSGKVCDQPTCDRVAEVTCAAQ